MSPVGSEQEIFRLFRPYTKMYQTFHGPQLFHVCSDISDPTGKCTGLLLPPNFFTRFPLGTERETPAVSPRNQIEIKICRYRCGSKKREQGRVCILRLSLLRSLLRHAKVFHQRKRYHELIVIIAILADSANFVTASISQKLQFQQPNNAWLLLML